MGENSYNYKSNESSSTLDENAWSYWYMTANELKKENQELKAKLETAINALEDLQGHTDAILLFPHKDKMDLLKAEQRARQALKEIND